LDLDEAYPTPFEDPSVFPIRLVRVSTGFFLDGLELSNDNVTVLGMIRTLA
jgi:hypothetical protein